MLCDWLQSADGGLLSDYVICGKGTPPSTVCERHVSAAVLFSLLSAMPTTCCFQHCLCPAVASRTTQLIPLSACAFEDCHKPPVGNEPVVSV